MGFREKSSNIKYHENLSRWSGVVPQGRMDRRTEGQIDMTKLIFGYRDFANAPWNIFIFIDIKYDGTRADGGHRAKIKLLSCVHSTEVTT